ATRLCATSSGTNDTVDCCEDPDRLTSASAWVLTVYRPSAVRLVCWACCAWERCCVIPSKCPGLIPAECTWSPHRFEGVTISGYGDRERSMLAANRIAS